MHGESELEKLLMAKILLQGGSRLNSARAHARARPYVMLGNDMLEEPTSSARPVRSQGRTRRVPRGVGGVDALTPRAARKWQTGE